MKTCNPLFQDTFHLICFSHNCVCAFIVTKTTNRVTLVLSHSEQYVECLHADNKPSKGRFHDVFALKESQTSVKCSHASVSAAAVFMR